MVLLLVETFFNSKGGEKMSLLEPNERDIKKLHYDAEMSCPKWNNNRPSRDFRRSLYLYEAQRYSEKAEFKEKILEYQKLHAECVDVDEGKFCYKLFDTYLWPYSDPEFIDWEYTSKDTLVYDQSHCVVKEDTSYVASKIAQITGAWPHKTDLDYIGPEDYGDFLAESGFKEITARPNDNGYYVGINLDIGKNGMIVWYEGTVKDKKTVIISTYLNRSYMIKAYRPELFSWIKIK